MISALLVLWLAAATPLEQAERAVMEGQNALHQQRYADAARVLQEGVEAAAAIDNPEVRTQALAAIHFFSALAYTHVGEMGRAREEIERFLIYSSATKSVDKSQYPEPFVTAFVEVSNAVRAMRPSEFDRRYPGYRLFSAEVPEHSSWEPAARYLATPAELDAWKAPIGEEARERFLDEFWTRRDPTPKTEENEFRSSFDARVAFADRAFAGPQGERGSLTERGRALVLLGKPREVMFEKISSSSEAEIWGYDRVKSWRQVWKTNFSASVARVHFRSSRHTGNPRWTSGLPEIAKVGFPDLTPTFRLRLVETGRRTLSENGVNCAGRPIVAQVARLKRDLEG